jgi:putative tricarboxylic transport membrane protein
LVLHGLEPGPLLLIEHEGVMFSLIVSLTISCIVATVFGFAVTRWLSLITLVDVHILVPAVVAISLVGAYAIESKIEDVVMATVAGVLGYYMIKFRFPRVTLVIALVLGDLAERSFHQTMQIADNDWTIFVRRPISLTLLLLVVLSLSVPALRLAWARRKAAAAQ